MAYPRKTVTVLIVLVVLGAAVRIALPFVVKHYLNEKLAALPDYAGHVEDVGMSLWRGAYDVEDVTLRKREKGTTVPMFHARRIDVSVEWKPLFHRVLSAWVTVDRPVIYLEPSFLEESEQEKIEKSRAAASEAVTPFRINRLVIKNGELHFSDPSKNPPMDLFLNDIQVVGENLRNVPENGRLLPASVKATATAFGSGSLDLDLNLDVAAAKPTFELKETLKDLKLANLNPFLKEYGKFTVKDGTISLYTEVAAKDGEFTGYTKPVVKGLKVDKGGPETKKFTRKVWANVVAAVGKLLKNPKKKQVAATIPVHGTFDDPKIGLWPAVGSLLKNAFVQALVPSLDPTISLGDVGK